MTTHDAEPVGERSLTLLQAYEAAYRFLAHYYELIPDKELFLLLGNMAIARDDTDPPWTADPGCWGDWLRCVQATLDGEPEGPLPPFFRE
jgi:hypothetical protein